MPWRGDGGHRQNGYIWLVCALVLTGCGAEEKKDGDGDGYFAPEDCNDRDPNIRPNVGEACDGVDNNCDGQTDESGAFYAPYWYPDDDSDEYGDLERVVQDCLQPEGHVAEGGDCDDGTEIVNPGMSERCNEIDDDCNGVVDEDSDGADTWFADEDEDGLGDVDSAAVACFQPDGYVDVSGDCDDTDPLIGLEARWYSDDDEDGYGNPDEAIDSCNAPLGRVTNDEDCDDTDAAINPMTVWYADIDGDSSGDELSTLTQCEEPADHILIGGDCDDNDVNVQGTVDLYVDGDGDGYGAGAMSSGCPQPGYALNDADCDDSAATVNPLAADLPGDGIDQDCDGAGLCDNLVAYTGDLTVDDSLAATFCNDYNAVDGSLIIDSTTWTDIGQLSCLCAVDGDLEINSNHALTSLSGLENLRTLPGALVISGNDLLVDVTALSGLTGIGGDLTVTNNTALTDVAAHSVFDMIPVAGAVIISGN
jgi:Putative metal-binding motif